MAEIKRLRYFDHQFLVEADFTDEQAYHRHMRHLHNRSLHLPGIVDTGPEALQVVKSGDKQVTVKPGVAVDSHGRAMKLSGDEDVDLSVATDYPPGATVFITIQFGEEPAEEKTAAGVTGYTRMVETPVIAATTTPPDVEAPIVLLTRFEITATGDVPGNAGDELESDSRQIAGARLAPASVTEESLSAEVKSAVAGAKGWVRLPFLPQKHRSETEFENRVVHAQCGVGGASGNMGIPVPPGATRILNLRIAATTNAGVIKVSLFRAGVNGGDAPRILFQEISTVEDATFAIDQNNQVLAADSHGLGLLVEATGKSDIWLVAAEFE